jgi:hypothetical protein
MGAGAAVAANSTLFATADGTGAGTLSPVIAPERVAQSPIPRPSVTAVSGPSGEDRLASSASGSGSEDRVGHESSEAPGREDDD